MSMHRHQTWLVALIFMALLSLSLASSHTMTVDPNYQQCMADIFLALQNKLPNMTMMIENSGKGLNDPGNFDGCNLISNAHYCRLGDTILYDGTNSSIYVGVCLPKPCTESAFPQILNRTILPLLKMKYPALHNIELPDFSMYCNDEHVTRSLSAAAIFTIVLIAVLAALALVGTVVDVYHKRKHNSNSNNNNKKSGLYVVDKISSSETTPLRGEDAGQGLYSPNNTSDADVIAQAKVATTTTTSMLVKSVTCFSLEQNLHWFMETKTASGPLGAFNGLRTFMMLWVILGHTLYVGVISVGFDNFEYIFAKVLNSAAFQLIIAGEYAVDAFFFMSGFLGVYMMLKEFSKVQKVGFKVWIMSIVHRYLRLTPTYAFTILVFTALAPYLVPDSPFSGVSLLKNNSCTQYWWTNLLYINNFYPVDFGQECTSWGWYLANDMQFFIFTPFFVMLYLRFCKREEDKPHNMWVIWLALAIPIGLSWALNGYLTYHYQLDMFGGYVTGHASEHSYQNIIYEKPYTRCPAYCIGMLLGFILEYPPDLLKSTLVRWAGYAVGCVLIFTPMFGTYSYFNNPGWSTAASVSYIMLSRSSFVTGMAIFMYATIKGHTGLIKRFLSAPFFAITGKLTYGAYLLHPVVIIVMLTGSTRPMHYSGFDIAFHFIGFAFFANFFAFLMYMLVEKPSANLERLWLMPTQRNVAQAVEGGKKDF